MKILLLIMGISLLLSFILILTFHFKKKYIFALYSLIFGAIGTQGWFVISILRFKVDADPNYSLSYYIAYCSTILYTLFPLIICFVSIFCIPAVIMRMSQESNQTKNDQL